ncbi:hypothetical protein EMCRGX_G028878 [Ephydatia muelleri]
MGFSLVTVTVMTRSFSLLSGSASEALVRASFSAVAAWAPRHGKCSHLFRKVMWLVSAKQPVHGKLQNIELIHAFTCAGMLPQQFVSFCSFAGIGAVKKHYMQAMTRIKVLQPYRIKQMRKPNSLTKGTMYTRLNYRNVVNGIAETSMQNTIEKFIDLYLMDGDFIDGDDDDDDDELYEALEEDMDGVYVVVTDRIVDICNYQWQIRNKEIYMCISAHGLLYLHVLFVAMVTTHGAVDCCDSLLAHTTVGCYGYHTGYCDNLSSTHHHSLLWLRHMSSGCCDVLLWLQHMEL